MERGGCRPYVTYFTYVTYRFSSKPVETARLLEQELFSEGVFVISS